MSITSGAFAIISSVYRDSNQRAKAIARLEGTIALGCECDKVIRNIILIRFPVYHFLISLVVFEISGFFERLFSSSYNFETKALIKKLSTTKLFITL